MNTKTKTLCSYTFDGKSAEWYHKTKTFQEI